jgi:hypothetical protein
MHVDVNTDQSAPEHKIALLIQSVGSVADLLISEISLVSDQIVISFC